MEISAAAQQIRDWLNQVLEAKEWSARSWAEKAKVAPSTVQRALRPDYQFVTSSRTLEKLARAAGVESPAIEGTGPVVEPEFLPVRYFTQAGAWYEIDESPQVINEVHPVAPDPRFAGHPQWLEKIVGDSVDKRAPDGAYAHVVDAISIHYEPKTDHFVVLQRTRSGGHLRERSIKQVKVISAKEVEFWPRSNNPRWSTPLVVTAGHEEEEIEVAIVGLVIGFYEPIAI